MEGSAGKANQSDPKMPLGAAGLPEKTAAAWLKAQPRFTGNFKRDAAAGTKFWSVEDLVDDAAKLIPGLTPTRRQVAAEAEHLQSEKDGVEVDQGIFLAQV